MKCDSETARLVGDLAKALDRAIGYLADHVEPLAEGEALNEEDMFVFYAGRLIARAKDVQPQTEDAP